MLPVESGTRSPIVDFVAGLRGQLDIPTSFHLSCKKTKTAVINNKANRKFAKKDYAHDGGK